MRLTPARDPRFDGHERRRIRGCRPLRSAGAERGRAPGAPRVARVARGDHRADGVRGARGLAGGPRRGSRAAADPDPDARGARRPRRTAGRANTRDQPRRRTAAWIAERARVHRRGCRDIPGVRRRRGAVRRDTRSSASHARWERRSHRSRRRPWPCIWQAPRAPLLAAKASDLVLAQQNLRGMQSLDAVHVALHGLFRAHMATAIRRQRLARREQSIDTLHLTVGFVDLVGFTTLSRRMTSRELAEVIDRFEESAHDIVTARDGRLVKLIGDEVMFVSVDAERRLRHRADAPGALRRRPDRHAARRPRLGRAALSRRRLLRPDRQPGGATRRPGRAARAARHPGGRGTGRGQGAALRARRQAHAEGLRRASRGAHRRTCIEISLRSGPIHPIRARSARGGETPARWSP